MSVDALPLAARLEALVCRNKVLAQEKEALEVAIATLYIELRHAKAARTQAETIAARAHERAAAVNQREAKMNAAFSASTHEMCLLRQDMCRLRDELQTSQQETLRAHQDVQHLCARWKEACTALYEHLRGPEKPCLSKDERVLQQVPPFTQLSRWLDSDTAAYPSYRSSSVTAQLRWTTEDCPYSSHGGPNTRAQPPCAHLGGPASNPETEPPAHASLGHPPYESSSPLKRKRPSPTLNPAKDEANPARHADLPSRLEHRLLYATLRGPACEGAPFWKIRHPSAIDPPSIITPSRVYFSPSGARQKPLNNLYADSKGSKLRVARQPQKRQKQEAPTPTLIKHEEREMSALS